MDGHYTSKLYKTRNKSLGISEGEFFQKYILLLCEFLKVWKIISGCTNSIIPVILKQFKNLVIVWRKKKISLVLDHLIVEFVNPKNFGSTFFRELPLLFSVDVIRRIEWLGHVLDVLYERLPSIVLMNQPKLLWMVSQGVPVKNLGVLQSSCHL